MLKNQTMDERFMDLALRLGLRNSGYTNENPAVGCVLVHHHENKKGADRCEIVGRGWTQHAGRPHAERVALSEAGERARGATAYVTLEPCSHFGKTSPCSLALIDAGVKRVVCALGDPDPRVAGRGFEMLREAGIDVEIGVGAEKALWDLRGFLSRNVKARPWLQMKMAFSPDGFIGKKGEGNFPITGPEAKAYTHGLRMQADAILVGSGTILADDPSLTVRWPGLADRSPIRVVLDTKGRIAPTANLVKTAKEVPTWIFTTSDISLDKAESLEKSGCRLFLSDKDECGHLKLSLILERLAKEGINRAMVESGAGLAKGLLGTGLVDECLIYRGHKPVGPGGLQALDGQPEKAVKAHGFTEDSWRDLGSDRLHSFLRQDSLKQLLKMEKQ